MFPRRWPLCPDVVHGYLRGVADNDRVLSPQLNELLELIRQYGPVAVAVARAPPLATIIKIYSGGEGARRLVRYRHQRVLRHTKGSSICGDAQGAR
jgi:hypothetical protein